VSWVKPILAPQPLSSDIVSSSSLRISLTIGVPKILVANAG
jgi:hypothetical protein